MIGITERGDAAIDFSWKDKLPTVEGAVLITKNCSDKFITEVTDAAARGHKLIVHATCTGLGGTALEPCVPDYKTQLNGIQKLIAAGFPKQNIILRVDPIFPNYTNWRNVIEDAAVMKLLPDLTVRISVVDMYKHALERLDKKNIAAPYRSFYAPDEVMHTVDAQLAEFRDRLGVRFVSCAEPKLTVPEKIGCISREDLDKLGIPMRVDDVNPQNRNGCLCLAVKKELLTVRKPCPHGCLYCFWKDA